jgi:hypothetical protein
VSREGVVLLEHAFSRERVFARAPGDAGERELSVFDRTNLADLSADGRVALLLERGAATGDRQFICARRTDGLRRCDRPRRANRSPCLRMVDGLW